MRQSPPSSTAITASFCPRTGDPPERASADGTKWDLYEQNLLSEYHIRYGGYGGIAYFVISAKYIALFSRFIPCGVSDLELRRVTLGAMNKSEQFNRFSK